MLHRIALPVVSEWYQKYANFMPQCVLQAGRDPHLHRGERARRRAGRQRALRLRALPMFVSPEAKADGGIMVSTTAACEEDLRIRRRVQRDWYLYLLRHQSSRARLRLDACQTVHRP